MIGEPLEQRRKPTVFTDLPGILRKDVLTERASNSGTSAGLLLFPLDFHSFYVVLNSIKTSLVEATMLDDNDQAP